MGFRLFERDLLKRPLSSDRSRFLYFRFGSGSNHGELDLEGGYLTSKVSVMEADSRRMKFRL